MCGYGSVWRVACGVWRVAFGVWRVACGVWSDPHSTRSGYNPASSMLSPYYLPAVVLLPPYYLRARTCFFLSSFCSFLLSGGLLPPPGKPPPPPPAYAPPPLRCAFIIASRCDAGALDA